MHFEVVVVGSYNQDHTWHVDHMPQPGETCRAHSFSSGPGGKGFNQAVASMRQGARTCFIAALGDDALAGIAHKAAHEEGLDCRWQHLKGGTTGSAGIYIDAEGQNRIVVDLAANEHLTANFLYAQADVLASSKVLLTQLEIPLVTVRATLELAAAQQLLRILDPAPVHPDIDASLLRLVNILTPNETELAQLISQLGNTRIEAKSIATLSDDELFALTAKLPVETVIVTLGAAGCFVAEHGGAADNTPPRRYRLAAEPVRALDSTGAGDAFAGALAALLAKTPKSSLSEAIRHANRCAALACETPGAALAMPTAVHVATRFAES